MYKIMVSGIGTGVGKTVVSAILTLLFEGDYWKPIQCGQDWDSSTIKKLIDTSKYSILPSIYSFQAPLSPHHAARLENISIQLEAISLPESRGSLIIEGIGGIFVPLTTKTSTFDLFKSWNCHWIIVSRHYLGSINHTLLAIEVLKQNHIPILGVIFNGKPNPDSEAAILEISKIPFLGRLLPEPYLSQEILKGYANQWQAQFSKLFP